MSQIGAVYGQALYDLAKDENLSDEILQELAVLEESFHAEPQFLSLLSAPNVAAAERCGILDECFRGKVQSYVLNFLKILTEKGAAKSFFDCVAAYREHYNRDHNMLPVTAVTAVALSREQLSRLTEKLSAITGKTALVSNRVDPTCLGGVRLDYDGKRVDGSVASRLESVRNMLKNTVL